MERLVMLVMAMYARSLWICRFGPRALLLSMLTMPCLISPDVGQKYKYNLRGAAQLVQTLASLCFPPGSSNNVAECVIQYTMPGNPQVKFYVAPNDMIL
jgi:hypothetical protein